MRKIPITHIKPGMILGKDLYDKNNSLLLSKGHFLTDNKITRIKNLKYQSVYILDKKYDDIEITEDPEDISDILRNNAVLTVKHLFTAGGDPLNKKVVSNVKHTVEGIVNEIILNKHATYTMSDLKLFDDYTYYHSVNVTVIAVILGYSIGLNKTSLYKLGLGALMHDIGKIFVPKEILTKQDKLTPSEYGLIQDHSRNGYEYLKNINEFSEESNIVALTHHEKFAGSGYPDGIKGNQIPVFGRILAVADVFDALVSDRPYRKALMPSEAVEYILGGSGDHFDPTIVKVFIEKISPYPVGSYVLLSNGEKGLVVKNRPKFGLRPKIKIINDSKDDNKSVYYDLSTEYLDITIKSIIY